jgi:hypothetical protein
MKVIFLAFANSSSEPLEFLTEEDKALYEILSERSLYGDYFIHKESFSTPEIINKLLDKYRDDLAVFHFSGHAGGNKLLVDDQYMFSEGIAKQLKYSADKKVLKLVVLNGCSTGGQVKILKENNIPSIISTSAPVKDKSAMEFSKRFWQKLVKEGKSIDAAYRDALSAAASVTSQDLSNSYVRHLFTDKDPKNENDPIWRLDCVNDDAIKLNPIPYKPPFDAVLSKPNEELIITLYNSFKEAGNPKIVDLWNKEHRADPESVSLSEKQIAIVNSIPFPMGIHLQKLICPTAGTDDDGYDEFGIRRLKQIAQLFQITTEFLCIIMIAQIWEIFIRFPADFKLDTELKNKLKEYIELKEDSQLTYDYIPLIQTIRQYLEKFKPSNIELKNFIDEQEIIKDLFNFNDDFRGACHYLANLRTRTINETIDENILNSTCLGAEKQLCIFVKSLGFIHRYQLTSVQNIDILKLRHIQTNDTEYKHRIIRCMQALGKDEWNYYYMKTFLDNWGVILLKCDFTFIGNKKYKVNVKDFLNLSPFVIDRNSFIDRADLANIMFFNRENEQNIRFKRVKNPLDLRDAIEIEKDEKIEDRFDVIRIQFSAFKKFIA